MQDRHHALGQIYKHFTEFHDIKKYIKPFDNDYSTWYIVNFRSTEWHIFYDISQAVGAEVKQGYKYYWVPHWKLQLIGGVLLVCSNPACRCFLFCPMQFPNPADKSQWTIIKYIKVDEHEITCCQNLPENLNPDDEKSYERLLTFYQNEYIVQSTTFCAESPALFILDTILSAKRAQFKNDPLTGKLKYQNLNRDLDSVGFSPLLAEGGEDKQDFEYQSYVNYLTLP